MNTRPVHILLLIIGITFIIIGMFLLITTLYSIDEDKYEDKYITKDCYDKYSNKIEGLKCTDFISKEEQFQFNLYDDLFSAIISIIAGIAILNSVLKEIRR